MMPSGGVLAGVFDERHIGAYLRKASEREGGLLAAKDCSEAFRGPYVLSKFNWFVRGRRPVRLEKFGQDLVEACRRVRPSWFLSTGICPADAASLREIGRLGVRRINYLTDDPWNPGLRAPWFFEALPLYDRVFSPRRSNLADLEREGCAASYLPFAYDPESHFREVPEAEADRRRFSHDVVFVGGADPDRVAVAAPLIREGFNVGLYGGYWERFPETRRLAGGILDLKTMRHAISSSKTALCLVRRANRDGHSMRTFEIPAMGTCMLAEDTEEHREVFGPEGKAVLYFRTPGEIAGKLRGLLGDPERRRSLAEEARRHIVEGKNTYRDRLLAMLDPEAG